MLMRRTFPSRCIKVRPGRKAHKDCQVQPEHLEHLELLAQQGPAVSQVPARRISARGTTAIPRRQQVATS